MKLFIMCLLLVSFYFSKSEVFLLFYVDKRVTNPPTAAVIGAKKAQSFLQCQFYCLQTERCISSILYAMDSQCMVYGVPLAGLSSKEVAMDKTEKSIATISSLMLPCNKKICQGNSTCIPGDDVLYFTCMCKYNRKGTFCEEEMTGESCLAIKRTNHYAVSGYYTTVSKTNPPVAKTEYCDMYKVDTNEQNCLWIRERYFMSPTGYYQFVDRSKPSSKLVFYCVLGDVRIRGGWTKVLHIEAMSNSVEELKASVRIYGTPTGLNAFDATEQRNYYPSSNAMNYLNFQLRFNQIRFRCSSPKRNHYVHVETNYFSLVGKMIGKWALSEQGSSVCNAFTDLENDGSDLVENCANVTVNIDILRPFKRDTTKWAYWYISMVDNIFSCQERNAIDVGASSNAGTVNEGDLWEVFLR